MRWLKFWDEDRALHIHYWCWRRVKKGIDFSFAKHWLIDVLTQLTLRWREER